MGDKQDHDISQPWYQALSAKFDALAAKFDALSQIYVTNDKYNTWQQSTDRRLDEHRRRLEGLEKEGKEDRERDNQEHSKLVDAMAATERRIIEKIEDNRKISWAMIVTISLAVIGWAISTFQFIVMYVLRH